MTLVLLPPASLNLPFAVSSPFFIAARSSSSSMSTPTCSPFCVKVNTPLIFLPSFEPLPLTLNSSLPSSENATSDANSLPLFGAFIEKT